MPELFIRRMREPDLASVHRIQCGSYPAHCHEPQAALASRLRVAPAFCFVAEQGAQILAYVLAHPWQGDAPALHQELVPRSGADHVFLHDLCVSDAAKGLACGRALFAAVEAASGAAAYRQIRIVALEEAEGFWLRMGFQRELQSAGAAYGKACLMSRCVSMESVAA